MDYYNYGDEAGEGRRLYEACFDDEGGLKSTWRTPYLAWLNELCDLNNIPEGAFRNAWIRDALGEAFEGDLDKIKQWFAPQDEDEVEAEDVLTTNLDEFLKQPVKVESGRGSIQ